MTIRAKVGPVVAQHRPLVDVRSLETPFFFFFFVQVGTTSFRREIKKF